MPDHQTSGGTSSGQCLQNPVRKGWWWAGVSANDGLDDVGQENELDRATAFRAVKLPLEAVVPRVPMRSEW